MDLSDDNDAEEYQEDSLQSNDGKENKQHQEIIKKRKREDVQ